MKKLILLFSTALLLIVCVPSTACVQDTTKPTLAVAVDAALTTIEIRVGNLKLHTETPNILCTCALKGYDSYMSALSYVAIVNSGTNDPYMNFAQWMPSATASTAWDAHFSVANVWDGYVANTINSGLVFNQAVDIVIRGSLDPGFSQGKLDSSVTTLATDMLDQSGNISGTHVGNKVLSQFSPDITSYSYQQEPMSYFTNLDNTISAYYQALSFKPVEIDNLKVNIYPNPINDVINIQLVLEESDAVEVTVLDVNGRTVKSFLTEQLPLGDIEIAIDNELESGFYMVTVKQGNNVTTTKVFKS